MWLCQHLGLGLPSFQQCEKQISIVYKPPSLWFYFFIAAQWTKTVCTSNGKLGGVIGYVSGGKIVKVIVASVLLSLG